MKLWSTIVVLVFAMSASGCGAPSVAAEDQPVGRLELALVGSDAGGQQYRLRNASFDISGYPFGGPFLGSAGIGGSSADNGGMFATTASSETNPSDPVISLRVVPGNYTVSLANNDWYIEQLKAGTATRVDKAVLLSDRSQYTWVYEGSVTPVAFRFGVGSDLVVDFRHGDLRICATFERPGDADLAASGGRGFVGGTDGSCDAPIPTAGVGGSFAGGAGATEVAGASATAGVGGGFVAAGGR